MCSIDGDADGGGGSDAAGAPRAAVLVERIHDLLDELLAGDASLLAGDVPERLVARLVAAEHRLHAATLHGVASFDADGAAASTTFRTTKRWLQHRTRLSAGAASHLTDTARAVRDHLPATGRALATGRISPQHVSAISAVVRKVGSEHARTAEPILLDLARHHDPATVTRATAALFAAVDPDGAEQAMRDAYERRGLRVSVVGNHGYLDGILDLESTELLQSALMPLIGQPDPDDPRTTPQRRADALLDIVKKHLDTEPMPMLGGHRPHLSVVVDADQLPPEEGPDARVQRGWRGVVTLPWTGAAIPAAAARRWSCHASLTPVVARLLARPRQRVSVGELTRGFPGDPAWVPVALGRSQRTASAAQLKALAVRDGGCVHPGCTRTVAYCDAHHVRHWVDGGDTDLNNLILLCRHHHRTLHSGEWALRPDRGSPGLFWAVDRTGVRQAQTALDRSPPLSTARVSTVGSRVA